MAERLSNGPHLSAIRAALVVTLPLMMLGSLAELLNSFPLPAYKSFMLAQFGPDWRMLGTLIKGGTFSVMSLVMLFSIGQHLADQHNNNNPIEQVSPIISGLISFSAFVCLLPSVEGILSQQWFGVSGLFVAMLVGVSSMRLFLFLHSFRGLRLYLPGGTTDLSIPQAFNALFPGMITVSCFAGIGTLTLALTGMAVPELVHQLIRLPFDMIGDSLGRGMLYIMSLQSLWFVGIHGANVLDPITHDIYGAAMAANEMAAAMGQPLPHVMTKVFMDTFVFMGGSGSTLCLIGALLFFGKSQVNRRLGVLSVVPGVFNINEIVLFGLPVVLNPVMLIPFILTPLLLAAVSYVAVAAGLVPGTSATTVWTTPILLNGYLCTGSVRGSMLQLFNLILGILTYAPFVILANKIHEKRIANAFQLLSNRACNSSNGPQGKRCLDYHDDAGSLARGLITDLERSCSYGEGLHLVYQPQISALNGRVVGVEALMRWKHPTHSWVPAPITIALAEDSGLIKPLGLWAFETACTVRKDWLDQGIHDLTVSVNVSALQLEHGLVKQFTDIIEHIGLPRHMVEIEVTESSALDAGNPESTILAQLNEYGMRIAIDDFGMGHSSLKYLKQFPVDTIKIDGAITKEIVTNPICVDIVASITRLCRARSMASVAEFVEDDLQVSILTDLGCDIFQGYKYSKPLDPDDCLKFIQNNFATSPVHDLDT